MRAIVVEHRGEKGSLRDLPVPQPGDHEILVRISAAGANPVDWKSRDLYDHSLPFTLGQDFAGAVADVGDRVTKYGHGDRVFGIARTHGSYADYTLIPEESSSEPLGHIPDDVGDADAAALPTAALTALACVERLQVKAGQTLLIVGVTGAVGQFAAQMALDRGATVIGTGGSAHAEIARALGIADFIAYDREDVVERVRASAPDGVDAVLDLADDAEHIAAMSAVLRKGGTIASTIRAIDEDSFKQRGFHGINVNLEGSPQSSHEGLREVAAMVERGRLRVPIVAERDLTDAVEALELVKSGSVAGKVVLTI
jgi:NADPH:quinone reductase-like Zn-dependent oxidoreductase